MPAPMLVPPAAVSTGGVNRSAVTKGCTTLYDAIEGNHGDFYPARRKTVAEQFPTESP